MDSKDVIPVAHFEKAMALLSVGVPPYCIDGRPLKPGGCWEFRVISSRELEENGFATLEDAEEAGFLGKIAYGFGPSEHREKAMGAFDKAWKMAFENKDTDVPDYIEVTDKDGTVREVNAAEIIAMGIAFAFRNADKFFPRRKEVRAKLKLEKDGSSFAILDRQSSPEVIEQLSQ